MSTDSPGATFRFDLTNRQNPEVMDLHAEDRARSFDSARRLPSLRMTQEGGLSPLNKFGIRNVVNDKYILVPSSGSRL